MGIICYSGKLIPLDMEELGSLYNKIYGFKLYNEKVNTEKDNKEASQVNNKEASQVDNNEASHEDNKEASQEDNKEASQDEAINTEEDKSNKVQNNTYRIKYVETLDITDL